MVSPAGAAELVIFFSMLSSGARDSLLNTTLTEGNLLMSFEESTFWKPAFGLGAAKSCVS